MNQTHCPDWTSLVAVRDEERYDETWDRALQHLEHCPHCRENAFSLEPTLIFQDLPALEVERSDVEEMKQAVAAMRRAQPIEARTSERSPLRVALRAAAVAGVGLAMLLLQGAFSLEPSAGPESPPQRIEALADQKVGEADEPLLDAPGDRSLVEELEPLAGTVIQLVDAELDMVVFYHDDLDV